MNTGLTLLQYIRRYRKTGVLCVFMASVFLGLHGWSEYQQYRSDQKQLIDKSVQGAQREIEVNLTELYRSLGIFVEDNHALVTRVFSERNRDGAAYSQLEKRLLRHFQNIFAFTLADDEGTPVLTVFKVGKACQADIRKLAVTQVAPEVVIHPSPDLYHTDLMVPFIDDRQTRGVFFVSLNTSWLSRILGVMEPPSVRLLLINRHNSGLIEVTGIGARDQLGDAIHLSDDDMQHIISQRQVAGTAWTLIGLSDAALFSNELRRIILEHLFWFALFLGVGLVTFTCNWRHYEEHTVHY